MQTNVSRLLGKSIAQARQKAGMTQEQLASRINISTRTFQDYEAGKILPRYHTLFKIAKETQADAPELMRSMWESWRNHTD